MVGETTYALEVQDIYKSFFNNEVLKGVSFGIKRGEVLGLVGSNGAGKSTLMKIVNGIYTADKGAIKIDGSLVHYKDARGARENGIAMVYQEFSIIPTMTVAQNLFLGVEPKRGLFIDDASCIRQAKKAFDDFNVEIDPKAYVEDLPIGSQQIVEIIKALIRKPSVLILDEPTASLTQKEIKILFGFIERLRQQEIAIVLISHHLQEIKDICDKVLVLRDGKVALDELVINVGVPEIIYAMIGRNMAKNEFIPPKREFEQKEPVLVVENIRWKEKVQDVSFMVYPGEILGIAGLLGSGRTEILKNIIGLSELEAGEIRIRGNRLKRGRPWAAIKNGVFIVPENRRRSGIIAGQPIRENMLLPIWKRLTKGMFINDRRGNEIAGDMIFRLSIRAVNAEQHIERLSGGNQQKVVFAKSMVTEPSVLLLDDPTVGIDIEAKNEIANLIRKIADEGNGVLLVSSEMEELVRIADRVLIMKQGMIINELSRKKGHTITEESLSAAIQA